MSTSTMIQALTVSQVLGELFVAFSASSLMVLALLQLAAVPFPLLAVIEINFICTLVVFAALRACGMWNIVRSNPHPGDDFLVKLYEKGTWLALAPQCPHPGGELAISPGGRYAKSVGELCQMV
ncbi:hypothetical protein B0H11DRAFT_1930552 [Mycena galericulata]|nr:hypothetical protein B0H11DRAFT_1930552 [Mycena galericulata]